MKKYFVICVFISFYMEGYAQNEQDTNLFKGNSTISLDYGNYNYYSIRYERFVWQHKRSRIGFNVGISGDISSPPFPFLENYNLYQYGFLAEIIWTTSSKNLKSHLEVGIEYGFNIKELPEPFTWSTGQPSPVITFFKGKEQYFPLRIGYRYQRPKGGLMFKAGYIPLVYFIKDYRDSTLLKGDKMGNGLGYERIALYLGIGWAFGK